MNTSFKIEIANNRKQFIPQSINNFIYKRKQYNQLVSKSTSFPSTKLQEKDNKFVHLNHKIMNNFVGFEDGRLFKIINVGDNSVIELAGKHFITQPQVTSGSSTSLAVAITSDAQTFQCKLKDDGNYEISSKHQDSQTVLMVWDYYPFRTHKVLIQKKQSRSLRGNQNWKSEPVIGKDFCYFILSAPECTSCLKNMGVGKEIGVVPKTNEITADPFTHWKLERLIPVATLQSTVTSTPQSALKPVVTSESTLNPVVTPPSTLKSVITTETTLNPVVISESTLNPVVTSESTLNPVVTSESKLNPVVTSESESTLNPVETSQSTLNIFNVD